MAERDSKGLFQEGNKIGQKYDRNKCIELFNNAYELAAEMTNMAAIAEELGIYVEWFSKYGGTTYNKGDEEIIALHKRLKTRIQAQIFNSGDTLSFDGKSTRWQEFQLKCNHGYKETSATEVTGAEGQPLVINVIPDMDDDIV